jgi:Domain of unknown function (DUF5050)
MKSKMKLLLSCFLVLFVTTLIVSCGDDDEPKKAKKASELYFTDYSDGIIVKFMIDDPTETDTILDVAGFGGVGLGYDKSSNMIFFTDFEVVEEGKIWKVKPDGTGLDDITTGLYEPYGLAVGDGKIYYADEADNDAVGHIYSSNLDGSGKVAIVTANDAYFRAVALDLKNDKIYYYDVETDEELGDLWMADLNGDNQVIVVPDVYGYAIAVDSKNGKIYFDDQNSGDGELKMADLDGTNIETVDETASRIYGIAIDNVEKKLYWSARDNGEIYKSNLDGSGKITLKTELTSPRGIFIK